MLLFVPMRSGGMEINMRFGANYIPSKSWLHFWLDFDEVSVKNDLLALKKLGCDHIRAHLIWSYFQPNATYMSQHCMKNLEKFVQLCEETETDFFLSLFTGWMSGFFFLPSWIQGGISNKAAITDDAAVVEAEEFYIKNISSVVSGSKSFLGFDLGNELTCLLSNDKIHDDWADKMFDVCNTYAPGKLHNNGVDHQPWFINSCFSRKHLANSGAITPMHTWTAFTGALDKNGILGVESTHISDYMLELARAYSNDENRLFWVQEFGVANDWANDENDRLEFMRRTFKSIEATQNLWGVTWWCSHDIDKKFSGYGSLEYNLGLLDSNNNPKPEGQLFAQIVQKLKNASMQPQKRTAAITVCPENSSADGWTMGDKYMSCIKKGIYPAIILPEKVNDEKYLKARGIEKIID